MHCGREKKEESSEILKTWEWEGESYLILFGFKNELFASLLCKCAALFLIVSIDSYTKCWRKEKSTTNTSTKKDYRPATMAPDPATFLLRVESCFWMFVRRKSLTRSMINAEIARSVKKTFPLHFLTTRSYAYTFHFWSLLCTGAPLVSQQPKKTLKPCACPPTDLSVAPQQWIHKTSLVTAEISKLTLSTQKNSVRLLNQNLDLTQHTPTRLYKSEMSQVPQERKKPDDLAAEQQGGELKTGSSSGIEKDELGNYLVKDMGNAFAEKGSARCVVSM